MTRKSIVLSARALSYWKTYFQPTYIGLRLLLDQLPDLKQISYLDSYLMNKFHIIKDSRYRQFRLFKGWDSSKGYEYRNMLAASPTAALGEAYVLRTFKEKLPHLSDIQNVYSYWWPKNQYSGSNYAYYYSGYSERNKHITELAKQNPDYHICVFDIKRFYPSINTKTVLSRLKIDLEKKLSPETSSNIYSICSKVGDSSPEGVPIGPAISPILGNIALSDVDSKMTGLIGNRYTRYVDDILLILPKDEINKASIELEQALYNAGLQFNPEKLACVSANDWITNITNEAVSQLGARFDYLVKRVSLLMWAKPKEQQNIHDELHNSGVSLPISQMAKSVSNGRNQLVYRSLFRSKDKNIVRIISRMFTDSSRNIQKDTLKLSEDMLATVEHFVKQPINADPFIKRLQISKLRFLVGRLIFVLPLKRYGELLSLINGDSGLFEHCQLLKAVMANDPTSILGIPGPTVRMFASIHHELGLPKIKMLPNQFDKELITDSLCDLLIAEAVECPDFANGDIKPSNAELLRFCSFDRNEARNLKSNPYVDELRSLQLNADKEKLSEYYISRYQDLEPFSFDSMMISEYGS